MRITLVSFHYPPDPNIGAVRPETFANSLRTWGHEVTVVSAASPQWGLVEQPDVLRTDWLDLQYLQMVRGPRAETAHRNRSSHRPEIASENVANEPTRRGGLNSVLAPGSRLRRAIATSRSNLIEIPDERGGWIRSATAAALDAAQDHGCDLLLASGPPFSAFVVAHRAARSLGIPWIADYRDLWSSSSYYGRSRVRRRLDAHIERRTLSNCSAAITVSDPLAKDLERDFSLPTTTLLNGFDPVDIKPISERLPLSEARLNLLYVGNNFYGGLRTPIELLLAARKLQLGRNDIRFHFVGSDPNLVGHFTSQSGTADLVEVHPTILRDQSLEMQARADALMLLMWNDPAEVGTYSGKIFEYIAVRRPIIMCGYANGVAAELIRERQLGHVVDNQQSAVKALSDLLQSKPDNGLLPDLDTRLRSGLSREEQNLRLERIVDGLLPPNS